jgi:hypothetical protein
MSEIERSWLAGVMDGEGSILLSKAFNRLYRRGYFYRPQLEISNSNRSFLIRIAEIVGEGTIHRNKKGNRETKTRWPTLQVLVCYALSCHRYSLT